MVGSLGKAGKTGLAMRAATSADEAANIVANAPKSYKALQALHKFTKSPRYQ